MGGVGEWGFVGWGGEARKKERIKIPGNDPGDINSGRLPAQRPES